MIISSCFLTANFDYTIKLISRTTVLRGDALTWSEAKSGNVCPAYPSTLFIKLALSVERRALSVPYAITCNSNTWTLMFVGRPF